MREKYQIEIENRIRQFDSGYVFTAADFFDIADTDPVNKALSRLNKNGEIRRIIKGTYDKPLYSILLKEYAVPDINSLAYALARKFNWTIAPTGETALNYLHLSTQVPNTWEYISDGPYRKYDVGKYTLEFKHSANKDTSGKSFITVIVIQAIKAIGKDKISLDDIKRLSKLIKEEDKSIVLNEARTSTAWTYKVIKEAFL